MINIYRKCPHCGRQIKLTKSSWDLLYVFMCPFCGSRLTKRHGKWGGIMGYKLGCE